MFLWYWDENDFLIKFKSINCIEKINLIILNLIFMLNWSIIDKVGRYLICLEDIFKV